MYSDRTNLTPFSAFESEWLQLRQEFQQLKTTVEQLKGQGQKKEYYNIQEAAAFLNCSVSTCRRLIKRGLIAKSLGIAKIQVPHDSLVNYNNLTRSR